MANLSITVAEVQPTANTATITRTAGATVTAGQVVYISASDNKFYLAQCDGTAAEATARGIALHAALAGQPLTAQSDGLCTIGASAAMTVGEIYLVSATAGSIAPEADIVTSTHYVVPLGVATAAGVLSLNIHYSGARIP